MSNKKFATLSSLNGGGNSGRRRSSSSSDESDDAHRQGFYVGGSQHSGQQVLGPTGARRGGEDLIHDLFASAQAHGAEMMTGQENTQMGIGGARAGSGYRLGDTMRPSELVPDTSGAAGGAFNESEHRQIVRLVMWINGFTVDDGPLRPFDDPANADFLRSIRRGDIPTELTRQYPQMKIDLRMERKFELFKMSTSTPFSGRGQRLGDDFAEVVPGGTLGFDVAPGGSRRIFLTPCPPPMRESTEEGVKGAQSEVQMREGEPVTQIQIRVPNGERLSARFNPSHTVNDLRMFIVSAMPTMAFEPFAIMTTFPSKAIDNEIQTLEEAGLLNSVVIARKI